MCYLRLPEHKEGTKPNIYRGKKKHLKTKKNEEKEMGLKKVAGNEVEPKQINPRTILFMQLNEKFNQRGFVDSARLLT